MADALSHSMVPLHEVLSVQEALRELEPWGIQSEYDFNKLPLIAIDDPALVSASQRATGSGAQWPAGQVVRVTRRSAYAGVSVAYRLVVPTSAFGRTAATGGVVFEQEEEEQALEQEEGFSDEDMLGVITEEDNYIPTDAEIEQMMDTQTGSIRLATDEEEEEND